MKLLFIRKFKFFVIIMIVFFKDVNWFICYERIIFIFVLMIRNNIFRYFIYEFISKGFIGEKYIFLL